MNVACLLDWFSTPFPFSTGTIVVDDVLNETTRPSRALEEAEQL